MPPLRIVTLAVAATLFAASAADAQTPIERLLAAYKKAQDVSSDSNEQLEKLKEGTVGLTDKAKAAVREKAQNIVFRVTQPDHHETIKPKDDALQPRNPTKTVDKLIAEARAEFIPNAEWAKLNENQKDYHRAYGAALFDAALLVMTDRDPPQLLRVNAARLLVPAAETGSPAVARGLTRLLAGGVFKDDKKAPAATPPDVLYYALRACETFLDKYDVPKPGTKDLTPDQLAELIGLLVAFVEKGPPILDRIAVVGTSPAADQTTARTAAVRFYRLQAVRALAKARADGYIGKTETLRPMHTLAKVAVRDPAIQPVPSAKEVGEATLGLMTAAVGLEVNADTLAYVVARGANGHFYPRAGEKEGKDELKLIDWKASAQKFSTTAAAWSAAVQKNPAVPPAGKKAVADAVAKIDKELFGPLLKAENVLGSSPNVTEVGLWLDGLKAGVPDVLINDSRDKTKYRMSYPK